MIHLWSYNLQLINCLGLWPWKCIKKNIVTSFNLIFFSVGRAWKWIFNQWNCVMIVQFLRLSSMESIKYSVKKKVTRKLLESNIQMKKFNTKRCRSSRRIRNSHYNSLNMCLYLYLYLYCSFDWRALFIRHYS